MSQPDRISESRWEEHKEQIRDLYLVQNKKLAELIDDMRDLHHFSATKAQYIRKLTTWKMKKNATQGEWKHAEKLIRKRKLDGKDTDIVMKGKVVSVAKLKKELGRYGWVQSYGPSVESPKHSPSAITAMTPPRSFQKIIDMERIPWFGFQCSARPFINRSVAPTIDSQQALPLANEQLAQTDISMLTEIVFIQTGRCTNTIQQVMSAIQAQMPRKSCSETGMVFEGTAPDPWVLIIEWAIYRCTNNHLGHLETYDLINLVSVWISVRGGVGNLFEKICGIRGPTTNIILSKLLISATVRGHSKQAQLLLEHGADPEAKETVFPSMSVLQIAAKRHDSHIVKLLLQSKADPNRLGSTQPPLKWAVDTPGAFDTVEMLVNAGACVNPKYAPNRPLRKAVWNGELGCANLLIQAGADITDPVALEGAIECKNGEMLNMLLAAGVDPNKGYRLYKSPLAQAVQTGDIDCVQILIAAGANIHDPKVLEKAVEQDDQGIFDCMIAAGANPDVPQLGLTRDIGREYRPDIMNRKTYLLHKAPVEMERDILIIQRLLAAGAGIDKLKSGLLRTNQTALQSAIKWCHPSVAMLLLDEGADPEYRDPTQPTPLQQACEDLADSLRDCSTQMKLINALLDSGANVNAVPAATAGSQTAMQIAVKSGDLDFVTHLMSHGGTICTPAADGTMITCLEAAFSSGNLSLVEFLVAKEPSIIQVLLKDSQSALQIDPLSGNIKMVNWVISLCAEGMEWNLQGALESAVRKGHSLLAWSLLNAGADVNAGLFPPLIIAIERQDQDLFDLLLGRGADPEPRDALHSPIIAAIRRPWPHAVHSLLSMGVDPNKEPCVKFGQREDLPLIEAVQGGSAECVRILLESRANFDDHMASKCLRLSISDGYTEIVQILLLYGADPNQRSPASDIRPIHLAIGRRHAPLYLDILRSLICFGANVNVFSSVAGYPLQMAQGDAREILLQAGADPGLLPNHSTMMIKSIKLTSLQKAAGSGDIPQVRILISDGHDVNEPAACYRGMTALQHASIMGDLNIAVLLLEERANINAPGAAINGRTALEGAAEHGRLDLVHLLLENDDEPELMGTRCKRSAIYARDQGHDGIARYLDECAIKTDSRTCKDGNMGQDDLTLGI